MPDSPSLRSEVGRLRTVLLHRPGEELRRITPSTMDELLFDELLWLEQAQAEHDAFATVLRDAGVEVLYIEQLLAEVLADPEQARQVVERHVTDTSCGPQAVDRVRDLLLSSPPDELVDHLIGGVTLEEVGGDVDGLVAAASDPAALLLQPVPNLVFMRDASAWIGEGVVLSPMNRMIRRRETDLVRTVYRTHERFRDAPIWFGDEPEDLYPATFEGGDLLVVGDRGIAVGISERTTPSGVETLAQRLFEADVVDRVVAFDLPKVRAAMHLDTIVTQVDVDAFITYPKMTASIDTYHIERSGSGVKVTEGEGLLQGLAWSAGLDHVRGIEPELGSIDAEREQWNDANNTLALAPGVVIAYERNGATNEILDRAGIEVRTIPSYELPRGRGGPRCMSCPVRRDPLP